MDDPIQRLHRFYDHLNRKELEPLLALLAQDVLWANAIEGGYVGGRSAVGTFLTRQWTMMTPSITPLLISPVQDDVFVSEVERRILDLDGTVLTTDIVGHVFRFRAELIELFDIVGAAQLAGLKAAN